MKHDANVITIVCSSVVLIYKGARMLRVRAGSGQRSGDPGVSPHPSPEPPGHTVSAPLATWLHCPGAISHCTQILSNVIKPNTNKAWWKENIQRERYLGVENQIKEWRKWWCLRIRTARQVMRARARLVLPVWTGDTGLYSAPSLSSSFLSRQCHASARTRAHVAWHGLDLWLSHHRHKKFLVFPTTTPQSPVGGLHCQGKVNHLLSVVMKCSKR